MRQYYVYWYHLANHTNPHKEGYVGVTCKEKTRHYQHMAGIKGSSKILCQAFKKYGDEGVIKDILHTVDSKEEAYELEQAYRPAERIGWNIAVGGGLPPDTSGRVDSPEVRRKRAENVKKTKSLRIYPSIFKGVTDRYTKEQRELIGSYHRNKVISDAHKQAISEKMSGNSSPKAKSLFLVHKDTPEKVYEFSCIKVAADSLNIPYNTLRSQAQRTIKYDKTSEPSRSGWICLSEQDAKTPISAVTLTIAQRKARFRKMTDERESNRKAGSTRVTSGINN